MGFLGFSKNTSEGPFTETWDVYLATMSHYGAGITPINHGKVTIDDAGFINGETPIEDFGCYFYQDRPFVETNDQLLDMFISFM